MVLFRQIRRVPNCLHAVSRTTCAGRNVSGRQRVWLMRSYKYILDEIKADNLPRLYKALAQASQLTKINFNRESKILTVEAAWDPEESVRMACQVIEAKLRSPLK